MNCKKCGYPLVPGQVICSNCGEYNQEQETINNNVINEQINNNNIFLVVLGLLNMMKIEILNQIFIKRKMCIKSKMYG